MTTRQQKLNQSLLQTRQYPPNLFPQNGLNVRPQINHTGASLQKNREVPNFMAIPDVSITSLVFFYRRVFTAYIILPFMLAITPAICVAALSFLQFISKGHPIFVTLFTIIATLFVRSCIIKYAPTEKQAGRALKSSKDALPLLCLISSSILCRFGAFIGVVAPNTGMEKTLFWSACQLGIYLGTLGFILNLLVLFRFVGPFAVVKCSNGPLQVNPSDSFISVLTNLSIVDAIQSFLNTITSPSKDTAASKQTLSTQGYFKKPTILLFLLQIISHAVIGYFFGSILFLQESIIPVTTAFTCAMNFIVNVFANNNHEIDSTLYPSLYRDEFLSYISTQIIDQTIKSMKNQNMIYQIAVPFFVSFFLQPDRGSLVTNLMSGLMLVVTSVLISIAITTFLCTSDAIQRLFLCQSIQRTNALFPEIKNMSDPSKNAFMTKFLIRTVLQNSQITNDIISYTPLASSSISSINSTNTYSILQENHFIHTKQLVENMSVFWQSAPVVHLAEEILRISTLANLSLPLYAAETSQEEIMFHFTCIMKALCVYLGGFGMAIAKSTVVSKFDDAIYNEVKQTPVETWLSPSAILEAEYIVKSILRLLSGPGNLTRNSYYSSHLHLHIPSFLSNLHILHSGIHSFGSSQMKIEMSTGNFATGVGTGVHGKEANLNRFIAVRYPKLKRIIVACEDTTNLISSGERVKEECRQSRLLSDECKLWLNTILD